MKKAWISFYLQLVGHGADGLCVVMAATLFPEKFTLDRMIEFLNGLVGAKVRVTLEIDASIPDGAPEQVVRTSRRIASR